MQGSDGALDPLLDGAPCGFLSFADDGTVRAVNATLAGMLGVEAAALVGRHVESVLTVGSRIFYQTHLFPVLRMHGRAEEIFVVLRAESGEDVAALLNAVRRERDGAWVTDCVLMRVRERRKFEDALLRARQSAEEAHAAADARSRELEGANQQLAQQALELELGEQQLQEQAAAVEAQAAELRALNAQLVARGEELERQRAAAESANRAKGEFLAVMSHELRTPLNAIGGYAELIRMGIHGPVTDAQEAALERVMRSQRHLLRLVNDVLNLSRLEAGKVEYDLTRVTLREVADAVLPMVEPQLAARAITREVALPPELAVRADRDKVEQILLNLLSNASKFTPPCGRVRVDGIVDPSADDRVLLRVSDTGVGIPVGRLDDVFEAFVQVDVSHTRRTEGTGLGLAISRDLARGMGGDLTVVSTVEQGSTFTLSLPRD